MENHIFFFKKKAHIYFCHFNIASPSWGQSKLLSPRRSQEPHIHSAIASRAPKTLHQNSPLFPAGDPLYPKWSPCIDWKACHPYIDWKACHPCIDWKATPSVAAAWDQAMGLSKKRSQLVINKSNVSPTLLLPGKAGCDDWGGLLSERSMALHPTPQLPFVNSYFL